MGQSLYDLFYYETDESTDYGYSDDEAQGLQNLNEELEAVIPEWYAEGLANGTEGSQFPDLPLAPPTPTNQATHNDAPPNQKSKYQRAKERGYHKCIFEDCGKHRASHSRFCRQHGGLDQICKFDGCMTRSRHAGLCKRHAPPQRKPQCTVEGCENIAQSRGLCHSHNPGITKCIQCGIVRPAYYAPVCCRCRGPRASAAETLFRPIIQAKYPDARLNRRLVLTLRPDVTLYTNWGGVLCVEIDEDSHEMYEARHEVEREIKMARALTKPVVFLRMNPDTIRDRHNRTIRRGLRDRFDFLMEEIEDIMRRRPRGVRVGKPLTILYYYSYFREQEIVLARRQFNI